MCDISDVQYYLADVGPSHKSWVFVLNSQVKTDKSQVKSQVKIGASKSSWKSSTFSFKS